MEQLCVSRNKKKIFFDPVNSHTITHFEDTPNLKQHVIEIIENMFLDGEFAGQEDMGRVVGVCDVVATNETDEIVYGVRVNREDDGRVPFVKGRKSDDCTTVALHLLPYNDNSYILSSAWVGYFDSDDEHFPESPNSSDKSIDYWSHRAFVYGSQQIIEGSEVKQCPW